MTTRDVLDAGRTAGLSVPRALLTSYLAGAILLLAFAGVMTQSLAIATGRDFVFGLVPKLNPGGNRNIPVWFASVAFAGCAAAAAFTALLGSSARGWISRRWRLLALVLALLSAERMASLSLGIQRFAGGSDAGSGLPVFTLTIVLAAVTVYAWCLHDLPRRIQAHFLAALATFVSGAAVSAAAPPLVTGANLDHRVTHMLMMSAGRLLELGGVILFLEAVAVNLRTQAREVRLTLGGDPGRILDVRHQDGILDLRLSAIRLRSLLVAGAAALLTVSLAVAVLRVTAGWDIEGAYRLLFVDFEGNVPTWYSSLLLLTCAALAACIAAARHHAADRQWRQWTMLAVLFAGLSADEAASLHELSVLPLRALVDDNPWLRYPLILPGIAGAGLTYLFFARFFRGLPRATRRAIYIGGGVLLFGALVVETISGWFDPVVYGGSVTYLVLATLEEGLEMGGMIVLLAGLLRHIDAEVGTLTLPGRRPETAAAAR